MSKTTFTYIFLAVLIVLGSYWLYTKNTALPPNYVVDEQVGLEGDKSRLMSSGTFFIDSEKSSLSWRVGKQVAGGGFEGETPIEGESTIVVNNGVITSGEVIVDLSETVFTSTEDENTRGGLEYTLENEVLNTALYPTARIIFKDAAELEDRGNEIDYRFTTEISFNGMTKDVRFPATVYMIGGVFVGEAETVFSASEWGVNTGAFSLSESADEITLNVLIVGEKR